MAKIDEMVEEFWNKQLGLYEFWWHERVRGTGLFKTKENWLDYQKQRIQADPEAIIEEAKKGDEK